MEILLQRCLIISGPTSSGKSSLAFEIAKMTNSVIISADAMTVFKNLNIGTAKPSLWERQEIIHYGIDCCDPDENFNISEFCDLVIHTMLHHQRVIIVGGTHYYISALLQPLAPLPERNMEIRNKIRLFENPHEYLSRIDSVTAMRLHPNDYVRIERAIEVYMITGEPLSELLKKTPTKPLIDAKLMILENSNLRQRIRHRIGVMMSQGYLQEAEMIFQNYSGDEKPFQSFSYFPLLQYLHKEISLEDALWNIEKGTWTLARKQRTWIKSITKNIEHNQHCIYDNKDRFREHALKYLDSI